MIRRIAELQEGVRERKSVTEPINLFSDMILTKLVSLRDRENEKQRGGMKRRGKENSDGESVCLE